MTPSTQDALAVLNYQLQRRPVSLLTIKSFHRRSEARLSREQRLSQLDQPSSATWDVAVIGGGAVGMGAAWDAVTRGYSCVLFEQQDFGKGTSSRSTKLVHGGVRYLAQGHVSLVREALRERGLLLRNAPSLVKPLRFVVPCRSIGQRWFYWTGMKCYDTLAGRLGIHPSVGLGSAELQAAIPGVNLNGLRGGVAYYDAQFDDARLVIALAQNIASHGGLPLNYMRVNELLSESGRLRGLRVEDLETSRTYDVSARVIINATGVFSDEVRRMENAEAPKMISASQGIHLVVDQRFLGGDEALMVPKTKDGRVLFAIPWQGRALLGTTDTPREASQIEPRPLECEVDYLLEHFADYLDPAPTRTDVLSAFAGLRPLVRPQREAGATSQISREHRIVTSAGGLVSVMGGKWTTFRKMAEDTVDVAEQVGGLQGRPCQTEHLRLDDHAAHPPRASGAPTRQQVEHAVKHEFARTVEDVLSRRSRHLVLDARRSLEYAPAVAEFMATPLNRSGEWVAQQVKAYRELAMGYVIE